MRALVRALAMLGWSILAFFTSLFSFAMMTGFLEGILNLPRNRVARDTALEFWTGVAFGIAGIIFLLGLFGRLPGTRRAPKGRPPAVRQ